MRWIQFSVAGLLALVTVAGIGCAALVHATPFWSCVMTTTTLAALFAGAIGALFCGGRTRAFSAGFALVGWGYFLLTTLPWLENVKGQLATTAALHQLQSLIEETSPENLGAPARETRLTLRAPNYYINTVTANANAVWLTPVTTAAPWQGPPRFDQIGHALWALIWGAIGGAFACFCARRRQDIASQQGDG